VTAEKCRFCGEWLDEDDEDEGRPSRPRRREEVEVTDFLVPTNVSGWSIASCYMGLIGFCLPFIGVIFAVPALIFGIIALRKRKQQASYGSVTSDMRAVIGLILSSLSIFGWGVLLIVMLLNTR
jgi:hypothetical protein